MITLPYRIEDLATQVSICRSISYDNAAGVYEIERAFSLIVSICDNINHDLSECYKIKSDGNHNLSAVQAVLDSARSVDVLKHVKDATTGINSKISDANQCESELKQLRHEIEHILHTLKSQLERLSSDESTNYQKVLSLRSYTLRPLLNDNSAGTSVSIHPSFQNGSDYSTEKVKVNRVSNHNSMVSENKVEGLPSFQSGISHSEAVPQVSIPASSLSNERIVEGIGGESSAYAVKKRSGTPFFTKSNSSYNNVSNGNVKDFIKQHGAESTSRITFDEKESLRKYTANSYANINAALRGIDPSFDEGNYENAKNIHSVLQRTQLPCDCTVYRGVSANALGVLKELPDSQLRGKVFTDKGFLSTSLSRNSAFDGDLILEIHAPGGSNGMYVGYVSSAKHYEEEVLFDVNQNMRIDNVRRDELGRRVIEATII